VTAEGPRTVAWTESSHGIDWAVELERADLLPGRIVRGRLRLTARDAFAADALRIGLTATEHWKHEETYTDAQGHVQTRIVTSHGEVVREPVVLLAPVSLTAGETRELAFEQPVPPLGPASLEADVAGVEWIFEAKLDVPGGFDSRTERVVTVHQPTALLRAGAVPVGEFALYDSADFADGEVSGSIELYPVPLVCGAPFRGRAIIKASGALKLQEIRAELRVDVEATVSGGQKETITAWEAVLLPEGTLGGDRTIEFEGQLPERPLPTVELLHGRTAARFELILAIAWAPDRHLVRDVAVATTAEL
jgi:hypothetical protein